MAEKKKKRVLRQAKPETVREKAAKASEPKPEKKRTIRKGVSKVSGPLKSVARFIKKILKPFSFLLIPFRTKPARFIGRILSKVLLLGYFKASWRELTRVEWPSRKQTINLTMAVFLFAIGLTGIISGTDWILDKVFKQILLR